MAFCHGVYTDFLFLSQKRIPAISRNSPIWDFTKEMHPKWFNTYLTTNTEATEVNVQSQESSGFFLNVFQPVEFMNIFTAVDFADECCSSKNNNLLSKIKLHVARSGKLF